MKITVTITIEKAAPTPEATPSQAQHAVPAAPTSTLPAPVPEPIRPPGAYL